MVFGGRGIKPGLTGKLEKEFVREIRFTRGFFLIQNGPRITRRAPTKARNGLLQRSRTIIKFRHRPILAQNSDFFPRTMRAIFEPSPKPAAMMIDLRVILILDPVPYGYAQPRMVARLK
jgi:hypothetical protein